MPQDDKWKTLRCLRVLRYLRMTKVFWVCFVVAWLAISLVPVGASAQISPGELRSAARISSVTGLVVDADSKPVSGAEVRLTGPTPASATTNGRGNFTFLNVVNGTYQLRIDSASLGSIARDGVVVDGDLVLSIRFERKEQAGLKTIAQVSTLARGNSLNTTAASIASVDPGRYALEGNVSWRDLLAGVPGVAVSGALAGGDSSSVLIPDSPFQPIVLSINGALPYETSTTLDGMPLSNYSLSTTPGAGVDLSELPLSLFDTADVVRGPGANAPSIADSIGGSFVLHPPGNVDKNSGQASFSSDAYGGYFSTSKATVRAGKVFATIGYSFNTSPGPNDVTPFFGVPTFPGESVSIDGRPIQPTQQYVSNPVYGNCFCTLETTLMGSGGTLSTEWAAHNGGIALGYNVSRAVTGEIFYAGARATSAQANQFYNEIFAPGATYAGSLLPGNHQGSAFSLGVNPQVQSASLLEEKVTANVGTGVLRLAALQNSTYDTLSRNAPEPTRLKLFGTGSDCDDPKCETTTPFTLDGDDEIMTFSPFTYFQSQRSTNSDFLASYDTQVGSNGYAGGSWVKTANSAASDINLSLVFNGTPINQSVVIPTVTQSITEYRLHVGFRPTDKIGVDASYYFSNANYHVPNPGVASGNSWLDAPFSYSAPRLGLTWQPNRSLVFRAAAGGGFALPPLFFLVGTNGQEVCSNTACYEQQTNVHLRPETSFGWDVGSDARPAPSTIASIDLYRADLYGQMFQSQSLIGTDSKLNLPIYAQEFLNLARSRFEGVNLSVKSDPNRGFYYRAGLGLTRGYVVTLPQGFYDSHGGTCNYSTGANCTNTYVIPGANFNGVPGPNTTVFYQAAVPYANGRATFGYTWLPGTFAEVTATYYGNNNAYLVPAFMEFDARAGYRFQGHLTIIAAVRNFTGIHDQSYQVLQVNPSVLAPTIVGLPLPQYPMPYGPRSLSITANLGG